MPGCVFCNIVSGKLSSDVLYQGEDIIAFRDINPQAPSHILIIPKKHIPTVNDLQPTDAELLGKMILVARDLAQQEGIAERGFRLIINCNRESGQAVYHLHLHLIGGRRMRWPPG
ncbi:MAG: histidine triad nucleotide-binding protein [candidate division KSB1 bacterium]|nr:histidine triad nucleotide-binding protein [candidate division KSB1 bacterium]